MTGVRQLMGWILLPLLLGSPAGEPIQAWESGTAITGGATGPAWADTLSVGRFEALLPALAGVPRDLTANDVLLSGWVPLTFGEDRGHTQYEPASVNGRNCLMAKASSSGSGLLRPLEVSPDSLPRVRWSWWVEGPVPGGDVTRKA
ncbi:DUF3047 domain-containing protein, partial [Gemmatimonadota bacterium]